MLEGLHHLNEEIFVILNHLSPNYANGFWVLVTKTWTWIPLYAGLLYSLYQKDLPRYVLRIALIIVGVVLWDQGAEVAKHYFSVPRPCQTLENIRILVHCGEFGFFSAHAANSFGLFFLVRIWVSNGWAKALFIAAALQTFSRIAVGVHYPFDLVVGIFWGFLVSFLLHKIESRWN
ncbi:MAG: hypothetical protein RLZZ599_190 [Bacteroidota bacterium]|jgi:undecaprenyl-diphosphatase